MHGFLCPNGSGKSTTIRVLLGLIRAEGGRASVLGGDPWRDAVALHRRISYVPGDMSRWPNLTGGQAIDIIASLRGDRDAARIATFVERFDLDPSKKARSYSKENRQKIALVAALASRAELLIFDEPTSGLDPLMERVFQSCVEEIKAAGRTVLLPSHIFSEVQRLCDAVTIIRKGQTVEVSAVQGEVDLETRYLSHYGAAGFVGDGAAAGGSPGDGVEVARGAHRAVGDARGAA